MGLSARPATLAFLYKHQVNVEVAIIATSSSSVATLSTIGTHQAHQQGAPLQIGLIDSGILSTDIFPVIW